MFLCMDLFRNAGHSLLYWPGKQKTRLKGSKPKPEKPPFGFRPPWLSANILPYSYVTRKMKRETNPTMLKCEHFAPTI